MEDPGATLDAAETPLTLAVSSDRMRITLTCSEPLPALTTLLDDIEAALAALPFSTPPPRAQWESRVSEAVVLQELTAVTILEGTPPVHPVHGRIDWVTDFFSAGFVVDEATGKTDYRQRAAQRSVEKGQLLGHVVPPTDGVEGLDVLGRKVPVEKARPARLRAGTNVRIDEADGSIHAEATGRIRLKDNLVSVDEVFTIEGSVGLETGNIRHPGSLVVRGDVEADSIIETAGTIEVMGHVEPCTIITEGDLFVHGGIAGAEGKRIEAGTVRAKFILDATIEADGDVVAETEIVQSHIRARGVVSCVRGRIVGGHIVAQGGIEAAQTGSEAGTRTVLDAGEDLQLGAALAACDESLVAWKRQRDRIVERVAPMRERLERLEPHVRDAMAKLEAQVAEIETEMNAIQEEKRRLREESLAHCRPEIYIYGRAYSDCYFALAGEHMRLSDTLVGPMCFQRVDGRVCSSVIQGSKRGSQLLDSEQTER